MNSYFDDYIKGPLPAAEKENLENNTASIQNDDAFAGLPGFGTGGMRSVVAEGSNRLNRYNIARLTQALAEIIRAENADATVVIGYDSRLSSTAFSRITYRVLRNAGLKVKVFKRPTPTPLISYAVRELKAHAGIVITASHNPPEYNGYKVYWSDGAQIVSPYDRQIEDKFRELSYASLPADLSSYEEQPVDEADLIEEEIIKTYLARLKDEAFITAGEKPLKIIYSPLHGTGGWIFEKAFAEYNFTDFSVLPAQKEPDGNFPTLKSPNPEEQSAFELLIEEGRKQKADLLLATDPDADRVGCAIRDGDSYAFITGNQIGTLLLESIARRKADKLSSPYICKTIVTTELQRRTAFHYGAETVETLTGFKYIAEQVGRDPDNYLFGGEESYGYLPVDWVRDKDSISSALALAELAASGSLLDTLDEIHLRDGLYHELLYNIKLSGGNEHLMNEILTLLKKPEQLAADGFAGRRVEDILDLQAGGAAPSTEPVKKLRKALPDAKVVQFYLAPEGRITVRPSGTEPKIKVYVSLMAEEKPVRENLKEAREKLKSEAEDMLDEFLRRLKVKH